MVCTSKKGPGPGGILKDRWSGGTDVHDDTGVYDHTHINNLKRQLDDVGAEYDRMVAITNQNPRLVHRDVDVIPLPGGDEYTGWWSKMIMYNSNLRLDDAVLFVDLDMMPGGQFNQLWDIHSDKDIVCRRAAHLDATKPSVFLPAISRPGDHNDHLAWIYNTSLVRFNPAKLAGLYNHYCTMVHNEYPLPELGDELFVSRWLLENEDTIQHDEFPPRLMPSYPSLMSTAARGETYDPNKPPAGKIIKMGPMGLPAGVGGPPQNKQVALMESVPQTDTVNSENNIPWDDLIAVTFGGPWKPWLIAKHDTHIRQRYYGTTE